MSQLKENIKLIDYWVDRVLYLIVSILMVMIATVVFYAVFLRYVLNEPPLWAEDVPRVFFLWLTYLGVSVAVNRQKSLRVTHFIEKFNPFNRLALELLMNGLIFIMLVVIFYWSFPILELQLRGNMVSTGWNYAWSYAPLPIGCFLMFIYFAKNSTLAVLKFLEEKED